MSFIKSAIYLARNNSFDGIDIFWNDHTDAPTSNTVDFYKSFRDQIESEARISKKDKLILSATLPGSILGTSDWVTNSVQYSKLTFNRLEIHLITISIVDKINF